MGHINIITIDEDIYTIPSSIKKININNHSYNIGIDTSDANSTKDSILLGKTAYVNGNKIHGSIPSQGAQSLIPSNDDIIIKSGVYLSGDQIIKGDKNLISSNIKSGVSIFGITGNVNSSEYLDILASIYFTRHGYNATIQYWNGFSYSTQDVQYGSATIGGKILKVIILSSSGGNICGHSGAGIYDSSHTNTISGLSDGYQSFAVLGIK